MMKFVAGGLGILTILALTGVMTPKGQAMLGLRPATQDQPNVAVIQDAPPAMARVPSRPAVASRISARSAATAPVARPDPPAQVNPAQSGLGQVANVANILLNLPQVLSQTQARPAPDETQMRPGPDNRRAQRFWHRDRERKTSENDDSH